MNAIKTEQLKQLLAEYAKVTETEASAFVDALVDTLLHHLKQGEEVTVGGLGVFYIVESQQGRRVAFRPEEKLKEAVNAPFSFFEPMVISEGKPKYEAEPETKEELEEATEPDEASVEETYAEETPIEETPVEEPEPEQEPEPEPAPAQEPGPEPRTGDFSPRTRMWIRLALVLVVLCSAGFLYYLAHQKEVNTANAELSLVSDTTLLVDTPVVAEPAVADTPVVVAEPKPENIVLEKPADKEPEVEKPKIEKPRAERPTDQQIMHNADGTPMTVSLGVGERLTLLSERFYGDKSFWGYIYEVNAFQISNPNVVPCHLKLYLPDAAYFGIDAADSVSVKRAKQKQKDIFKAMNDN